MQTTLQKLIERLKADREENIDHSIRWALSEAINKAKSLLPTEKQQIVDAHFKGSNKGYTLGGDAALGIIKRAWPKIEDSNEYYSETFKTEK